METLVSFYVLYFVTAIPTVFVITRAIHDKVKWQGMDTIMFLMPVIAYYLVYKKIRMGKALGNIIVELAFLGIACGVAPLIKKVLSEKYPQHVNKLSFIMSLGMLMLVFIVYLISPSLPE